MLNCRSKVLDVSYIAHSMLRGNIRQGCTQSEHEGVPDSNTCADVLLVQHWQCHRLATVMGKSARMKTDSLRATHLICNDVLPFDVSVCTEYVIVDVHSAQRYNVSLASRYVFADSRQRRSDSQSAFYNLKRGVYQTTS